MQTEQLPDKNKIRRIAIFPALDLGEMLCAIPAIRAIKALYPLADITLIGLPAHRSLVERFSHYFSDFIEFPGWPGLPGREYKLEEVMRFLGRMQHERYDLVVQMHGNGDIVNPMCLLFGARHVAGLHKEGGFAPEGTFFPVLDESEHEINRCLKIAHALGSTSSDTSLEFPILPQEAAQARAIMSHLELNERNYVCVHAGAPDEKRMWDVANFARVADALAARGYKILLTGSIEERSLLVELAESMEAPAVDLVDEMGHVGIGELGAIMARSAGLICNDTGVSHVAAALNVRSVVIFSTYSDPRRWKPLNANLHKCVSADESANVSYVVNTVVKHLDLKVRVTS